MKEYTFQTIKEGTKETFEVKITKDLIKKFRDLSGDFNPLHIDPEYAKETKFKKNVVYGYLVQLYLSKLAGMYLPGKYSLILSTEIKNKNPCFENDVLKFEGIVNSKITFGNIIIVNINATNQENKIIIEGSMKIQVLK